MDKFYTCRRRDAYECVSELAGSRRGAGAVCQLGRAGGAAGTLRAGGAGRVRQGAESLWLWLAVPAMAFDGAAVSGACSAVGADAFRHRAGTAFHYSAPWAFLRRDGHGAAAAHPSGFHRLRGRRADRHSADGSRPGGGAAQPAAMGDGAVAVRSGAGAGREPDSLLCMAAQGAAQCSPTGCGLALRRHDCPCHARGAGAGAGGNVPSGAAGAARSRPGGSRLHAGP